MYKVLDKRNEIEVEYNEIEDFLYDAIDDDMMEDYLNEMDREVEIFSFKFGIGKILRNCLDEDRWNSLINEHIEYEAEWIKDDLDACGETDYYDWVITDLDWKTNEE